ncbi:hypothetical protein [Methyloversatilis thermotolerans]|uniref:hypothetical protein n=1 Tax=Methyloversatilis thermotolerans TaxID=1346290 RepID=UPI000590EB06|nr:hypothetical protein [Methyloversatilis thermotolerans]
MTTRGIVQGVGLALLLLTAGAHAGEGESDRFFRECRAAWANNQIGSADELCYKSLTASDFKEVPAESRSLRIYNYAQLKRMIGNWEAAEELLLESLALEDVRIAGKPLDLPYARRLAELSIAYAAQDKWPEGLKTLERLLPVADQFQGRERSAVSEIFRNYVPQAASAGRQDMARQLLKYVEESPAPEPAFIKP